MRKLLCVMSLALVGCASEQAIQDHYYILPDNGVTNATVLDAPMLIIKTDLSEYLNNKGIVYRTSDTQILEAKHSLWAEGIQDQITQRIVSDLQSKQRHYWPIEAHTMVDLNNQKQLLISLQRFNGVYTGNAELMGEWMLIDGQGKVLANKHFERQVALKEEGYNALINALSTGLDQLTTDLANQLQ